MSTQAATAVRLSATSPGTGPVRVEVSDLVKVYRKGSQTLRILDGATVSLKPGERASLVGPSGCGKSTFMHLVGLLDAPTSGRVALDGLDMVRQPEALQHRFRNFRIGFVFQAHNLLPEHSALGNVMMPALLGGSSAGVAEVRASALLRAVGLGSRMRHKPGELSGGEQQRVAIARALVMGPGLVVADEPTGNLDPRTAEGVFELLIDLNLQLGSTLVVVTHSPELASRFDRRLRLVEGRFVE